MWAMVKPKNQAAKFKRIIACSFYSPPNKNKNARMADHIVTTLHMLITKYPESAIIMGADKNQMNITPILNCGLKLRQVVDKNTRGGKILDVLIMNISGLYKSPIIVPPIQCDNPNTGQASDHSVPVCIPHTDRYRPPQRNYRTIKYRPLPQSSIERFGEWIVSESWRGINDDISPTEQALQLEQVLNENLDKFCPMKEMKLGYKDKIFITAELKRLDRQKNREYLKRGKTEKYLMLRKKFKLKYKEEAEKYLQKNLESIRESNPGQVFKILKQLGAQPGDCPDSQTFSLPEHEDENLSPSQSAERIAAHFAAISSEYPPLNIEQLPARVRDKLIPGELTPPQISEYEVYCKIRAAKKPRSGIPGDLPKTLLQEFSPELATPLCKIIQNIFKSGEWPNHWKLEQVTPIPKIPIPENEDDLRPISLTPFFSKVTEQFVVTWLLEYIGEKIDFRQYGGLRGNSITHYIIEFINFILSCQDSQDQTAIMACMVDFSKAFNRQNHNIILTKLSDMGVPGWLLKIVIAFLKDRRMQVFYKGGHSSIKNLPGGGPQGTLLALLLFIVLINDLGFEGQVNNAGEIATSQRDLREANKIHLKYVDDFSLAEAIKMTDQLESAPDRQLPDSYHSRTGHYLPLENSEVFKQLQKTESYAVENEMKVNHKKTKLIVFNPCKKMDFMPEMTLNGHELEVVEEIRLLGIILRSDMKWTSNTQNMILKASKRLWILRRLKKLGASQSDLIDVYVKQIRCILELAVPAWQGSLSQAEKFDLERVQKCASHIILGDSYNSYTNALKILELETLESRRYKLALKFALKAEKHAKFRKWFRIKEKGVETRQTRDKYWSVRAKHVRYDKSPISFLTKLLNHFYKTN